MEEVLEPTAATRPIPSAAWCSTPAATPTPTLPPLRRDLLRPATRQLLAGRARGLPQRDRVYIPQDDMRQFFRRQRATIAAQALPRLSSAHSSSPKSTTRAPSLKQGLPLIGMVESRPGARSGPLQPRRPRNSARHRAARLRRAQRPPGHLENHQNRPRPARRHRQIAAGLRLGKSQAA
jgi:hypothetical protein